jgi:alpha-L-fucosidase 2
VKTPALLFLLLVPLVAAAKPYVLWYDRPVPDLPIKSNAHLNEEKIVEDTPEDPAWENLSLPVGNGYLGASLFGRTVTERVQLTENSLATNSLYNGVGLTGFADLYLDFGHKDPADYRRELSLNKAVSTVTYRHGGVRYRREYFASYPDKVLVIRLTADRPGSISFTARPEIPYLRPFGPASKNRGRDGTVTAEGNLVTFGGRIETLGILYEGQLKVLPTGGKLSTQANPGRITVTGADSVTLLVALGTNYRLESRVFTENVRAQKLSGNPHPHERVSAIIEAAATKSPDVLRATHEADYRRLFDRASLDFGGSPSTAPTDRLLAAYKTGQSDPYLDELYFNYGRYLLICSSRPGTLPPNLQGIWSQYEVSPWTGGYWHNINIQMNYWPVFNTNLAELFQSFVDFNAAYRQASEQFATNYITKNNPSSLDPAGNNGWTIGTAATPYNISSPGGHSGPGTGALTTKMFWDYYEFTGDKTVLRDVTYPALLGMARFLSKVVVEKDGLLLTSPSYSPEQRSRATKLHYASVGSAFDQQMINENHADTLKAAKILGDTTPFLDTVRAQLPRLDPVQVGASGQIKEYREEKYYGDLVDPKHRHISHLLGLYPRLARRRPRISGAPRRQIHRLGHRQPPQRLGPRQRRQPQLPRAPDASLHQHARQPLGHPPAVPDRRQLRRHRRHRRDASPKSRGLHRPPPRPARRLGRRFFPRSRRARQLRGLRPLDQGPRRERRHQIRHWRHLPAALPGH